MIRLLNRYHRTRLHKVKNYLWSIQINKYIMLIMILTYKNKNSTEK